MNDEGRTVTDKRRARRRVLAARRARSADERELAGAAVLGTLLEAPWLTGATTVACYYSVGGEPDTRALATALEQRGVRVLLPVFLPGGDLDWAVFDGPASLAPAGHGLLEPVGPRQGTDAPARADAVVCPALAVDRRGMRLGRGAGCYDRVLARTGPRTPSVAVVYDEEFVESVPGEPHDRPVDAVVTPVGGLRAFEPRSPVWAGRSVRTAAPHRD
ncbi:5-formyltetrahydrofolate cyclo-ligase [Nocardiopsis sp. CNT312]|uniref:5-formyltetrahydrofolate cyclo-ligase n=1 Tax=Nocardiopsis sp. CNT312 TaxID=1137268 RepID=UPI00048E15FF|nr:5-formyltetrahydrofolate cyclo-ligase [Nocardiopsis sp. CNT312]